MQAADVGEFVAMGQEVGALGGELEDAQMHFRSASHQAAEHACVKGRDF